MAGTTGVARRGVVKAVRVARSDGTRTLLARGLNRLVQRVAPTVPALPLFLDDVVVGEPAVEPRPWRRLMQGDRLLIDIVTTPPAAGSGGHSTIFRLVEYLEGQGHSCRLLLYDRYLGDVEIHEALIRRHWPHVRAAVADVRAGRNPADAVFATSWPTAHVVAQSRVPGRRFYLVQDFEPDFYPVGSERVLAEATYAFGFHGITVGRWLADKLSRDYGMRCDWLPFGCDTDDYRLNEQEPHDGVVFYAKPDVPRRAFTLGVLALDLFAKQHPEVDIHLFGLAAGRLPFRHTHHGVLPPRELNRLYNRCAAGLSLSLTNISLIPWELMASGCIPVVNEATHNRAVLDNEHVHWAPLEPAALAAALAEVVTAPNRQQRAAAAASSVQGSSWEDAGARLVSALEACLLEPVA